MDEYSCETCNYDGTDANSFPCSKCMRDTEDDKPSRWTEKQENDPVNHPAHYTGDIECIDAMLQQYGSEAVRDFCKLNAFKYLWRCDRKHSDASEDVQKARWYLNKYTELGGM